MNLIVIKKYNAQIRYLTKERHNLKLLNDVRL